MRLAPEITEYTLTLTELEREDLRRELNVLLNGGAERRFGFLAADALLACLTAKMGKEYSATYGPGTSRGTCT